MLTFKFKALKFQPLEFILDKDEIDDAIVHIAGYYRVE